MATTTKIEERERLEALEASGALEAGHDPAFDFLAKLAADRLDMPIAAITVMMADEIRPLSLVGVEFDSLPLEDPLTRHMLENQEPVILDHASDSESFADSAIISGLGLRAYCGVPLVTGDGHLLGAFSVADRDPRELGEEDVEILVHLADQVVANLERKRVERDLMLTVQRLQHGERLASVGSWEWEPATGKVTWSRGCYAVFGLSPELEPTYDRFLDVVHPEDRERVDRTVTDAATRTVPFDYGARIVRPDGEVRWIEAHGEVDVGVNGDTVMRGAVHDVTARESTATDLKIRTELLDRVESAAVIALDVDGIVTHWNHGAELLYGWGSAEALGQTVDDLGLFALNTRAWRERGAALRRGASWKGEAEIRRKDGTAVPAFLSSSVVTDEQGEIMGYVGVSVDLTGAKRAEADLKRSREETIHRLSRAVEMRDMDTGGHIVRIAEYAAEIARRLGLENDRVELIRVASPMHDVGKLGIADHILRKREALDADERREMKRHTTIGYEILSGTGADVLEMAATIALTHHERFDGTGYPRELAGDLIPIEGRIVAVADVYDALTSDRVYRKAFSHEDAVEMMRAERGTHFDPVALDAMLDLLDAR